jgi:hypothetical protein
VELFLAYFPNYENWLFLQIPKPDKYDEKQNIHKSISTREQKIRKYLSEMDENDTHLRHNSVDWMSTLPPQKELQLEDSRTYRYSVEEKADFNLGMKNISSNVSVSNTPDIESQPGK